MICIVITNEYDKPFVHVHGENCGLTLARALRLKTLSDTLFKLPVPPSVKVIQVFDTMKGTCELGRDG